MVFEWFGEQKNEFNWELFIENDISAKLLNFKFKCGSTVENWVSSKHLICNSCIARDCIVFQGWFGTLIFTGFTVFEITLLLR